MTATKRPAHRRNARRTLSLQPLFDHLRIDNIKVFAERAGYSRRTVYNWLELGISSDTADVLCIRLAKLHPCLVYGTEWAESYDEDFVPGNLTAAVRRNTTWASGSLPSSSPAAEDVALEAEEWTDEELAAGLQFIEDSESLFTDDRNDDLEIVSVGDWDDLTDGFLAAGSRYTVAA